MSLDADLHNFGRSVQQIGRASGVYFQKPRPLYWEWLFFGKDSPLAGFFETNGDSRPQQPRNFIFNLEIEMAQDFSGSSRQILPTARGDVLLTHAYSLGVLLGYCYVFGIRDLHRHNVIRTDSHLQVIDAEVVLVKLLLPHETLLLPFKNIGPDLCSASHLGNPASGFPVGTVKEILSGYLEVFSCIQKNRDGIRAVFRERRDEMAKIPVRDIVRDTPRYREWNDKVPEIPFFQAEMEQLSRGDIPYFFKFIGDKSLYAYTDPDGGYRPVDFPSDFDKAVIRDAVEPEILLEEGRLSRDLQPSGLLFLAKYLLPTGFQGALDLTGAALFASEKHLSVRLGDLQFESKR